MRCSLHTFTFPPVWFPLDLRHFCLFQEQFTLPHQRGSRRRKDENGKELLVRRTTRSFILMLSASFSSVRITRKDRTWGWISYATHSLVHTLVTWSLSPALYHSFPSSRLNILFLVVAKAIWQRKEKLSCIPCYKEVLRREKSIFRSLFSRWLFQSRKN